MRFVNCAFWGPCNQIARIAGRGTIGFSDCTFTQWDGRQEGRPALQVESGSVVIRGCEFQEDKPQIELGEKSAAPSSPTTCSPAGNVSSIRVEAHRDREQRHGMDLYLNVQPQGS